MTKYTIGVYQAYKNSGNLRFHKRNAKKSWKHYFIEVDDYDEKEYYLSILYDPGNPIMIFKLSHKKFQ